MAFISWSILEMDGKPIAHCVASGDHSKIFVDAFENLAGKPIRAPTFHKETVCWISEFSRENRPNELGDPNYFKRTEAAPKTSP